jgi:[acyl-carrier-protein] S-malonyltransferase
VIALLAPGQGAQKPGMLTPWLDRAGVAERITAWSELTGLDLLRLGTEADAEEIQDTAITQPLIVAQTLVAHEVLTGGATLPADTPIAGHSVGELAAAAMAGVLSPADAVALAAVRGREMAAACKLAPTSMAAVMSPDTEKVVAWLTELGLTPANMNGAGQIVAAGSAEALDRLQAEPLEGVKVIRLKVAGAFHTEYMAPAEAALREHAATIKVSDPVRPLLSNADGTVVTSGAEELERLIAQVTKPVRWDLCMATLASMGVRGVVELPPAGALSGLVKRELTGTATLPLKTPDNLEKLAGMLAEDVESK